MSIETKLRPLISTPSRHHRMLNFRAVLHKEFPQCFAAFGVPKQPLKKGIEWDIMKRLGWECHFVLGDALFDYTRGVNYLAFMLPGSPRIDLDGTVVDTVNDRAAAEAQSRLGKMLKWIDISKIEIESGLRKVA